MFIILKLMKRKNQLLFKTLTHRYFICQDILQFDCVGEQLIFLYLI